MRFLNIVFFIPESYASKIESITTPFARTEESTSSTSGGTWTTESYTANAYFYNLALPFRTHVTEMIQVLHGSYRQIIGISQGCHRHVTEMLQGYHRHVTGILQTCYREVTRMLQTCYKHVYKRVT